MSPGVVALSVILVVVVAGSGLAFWSGRRQRMDFQEWAVGSRGFGLVLVWLLMAGEVYSTFSLLGASGWAYSQGGPTFYFLSYMTLAYVVSFYILPPIWEVGRKHGLHTEADFFDWRYGNKYLGGMVALIGIVFAIPGLEGQLTGLGIIVEVASFGSISRVDAILIALGLVTAFVFLNGVRAIAWVSVVKDTLLLAIAAIVGFSVPYIYFGGIGRMFAAVMKARPAHLIIANPATGHGHAWFISTVVMSALGFYMWPQMIGSSFAAKSGDTLRRNAVAMPLYMILLPLVLFVGFAAILVVPGLNNGDLAFLSVVRKLFPAWFLGLVGGAGALTAMVPTAILILTVATLFAKNIYCPVFAANMSDEDIGKVARVMVLVIAPIACYFAIFRSTQLVPLLLLAYSGVTQFFPGVVLGLFWRRVSGAGIFLGLATGVGSTAWLTLSGHDPILGLNAGFAALCLNFLVAAAVSVFSRGRVRVLEEPATPS